MKSGEESLQDLWDTIKRNNIHIMGIPEEENGRGDYLLNKFCILINLLRVCSQHGADI